MPLGCQGKCPQGEGHPGGGGVQDPCELGGHKHRCPPQRGAHPWQGHRRAPASVPRCHVIAQFNRGIYDYIVATDEEVPAAPTEQPPRKKRKATAQR